MIRVFSPTDSHLIFPSIHVSESRIFMDYGITLFLGCWFWLVLGCLQPGFESGFTGFLGLL
jgi:hypothetical protein